MKDNTLEAPLQETNYDKAFHLRSSIGQILDPTDSESSTGSVPIIIGVNDDKLEETEAEKRKKTLDR